MSVAAIILTAATAVPADGPEKVLGLLRETTEYNLARAVAKELVMWQSLLELLEPTGVAPRRL